MHDVQHKGFRHTLAAAGMAASLVFLLASMFANFKYGSSLAKSAEEGYIYGAAAAACDVLMAICPFFFGAAWRNRNFVKMLGAGGVWAVMTAVAAVSAISQTSVNRIDAISARVTKSTSYGDTRAELEKARSDRGFVPQSRPIDTVKADIQGMKARQLWNSSSECSEATGKAAHQFCDAYFKLSAELGAATQAQKLDDKIAELIAKSNKAIETNPSVAAEADAGAKSLSVISGYDVRSVQSGIVTLIAVMFLVGAGLGPSISWSVMEIKPDKRGVISIEAELLPPSPPDAPKLEPAKAPLALPKPETITLRAEPSPEWRALLDAVDFPRKKVLREKRRPQDERSKLGWRFFVWLSAYGYTGTIHTEELDRLYDVYANADNREQWSTRIAKAELTETRWVKKDDAVRTPNGPTKTTTVYTLTAPPIERLKEQLIKRKVIKPDPTVGAPAEKTAENKPAFRFPRFWADLKGQKPQQLQLPPNGKLQ